MTGDLIAGLDVGTTNVKLYVYEPKTWKIVYRETVQSPRIISKDGETRHDAEKLYEIVRHLYNRARDKGAKCLGLSTYRGSLVLWRSRDGKPVSEVITWMDTSSYKYYEENLPLLARIFSKLPKIGSAIQPESFIVKLADLLHKHSEFREQLESGELYAWNIDAYLAHRLFGEYVTDPSIAGLTGLYHPKDMSELWIIAKSLNLPRFNLPRIAYHDEMISEDLAVIMGDQQSAMHGLKCYENCVKITLGTGAFIDMPTGSDLLMGKGRGLVPLVVYWSKNKRMYGIESYVPGLGEAVSRIVNGLLGGDYSKLDTATEDPARILLYAWGVRYPRLPPGPITIKFDRNHVSPDSIGAGLVEAVVEAVVFHLGLVLNAYRLPDKIVLTGGLTRSRRIVETLRKEIKGAFKINEVVLVESNPSSKGVALLASEICSGTV